VQYDEVILVLEGEVTVRSDRGELKAGPRDCIWLPKGTALTYSAESALVFYAIQPANWAEG
jgi:ethanolamine utilization protein EutQ